MVMEKRLPLFLYRLLGIKPSEGNAGRNDGNNGGDDDDDGLPDDDFILDLPPGVSIAPPDMPEGPCEFDKHPSPSLVKA
jgi:hypothetical protein